jgi:hypothetical protein
MHVSAFVKEMINKFKMMKRFNRFDNQVLTSTHYAIVSKQTVDSLCFIGRRMREKSLAATDSNKRGDTFQCLADEATFGQTKSRTAQMLASLMSFTEKHTNGRLRDDFQSNQVRCLFKLPLDEKPTLCDDENNFLEKCFVLFCSGKNVAKLAGDDQFFCQVSQKKSTHTHTHTPSTRTKKRSAVLFSAAVSVASASPSAMQLGGCSSSR